MEKENNKKICFNFPSELIKKIDNYASRMNVNRTSAICFLVNKGLENEKKDN